MIQAPNTSASSILQFATTASGSATPINTITAAASGGFFGVNVDSSGNIEVVYDTPYVNGVNTISIDEFAAGSTGIASPVRTIPANSTTGFSANASGLSADQNGVFYVAAPSGIIAFSASANGSVAPSRSLPSVSYGGALHTQINFPSSMAFDAAGDLFVMNTVTGGADDILVFGPTATGDVAPLRVIGGALTGFGSSSLFALATDASGNLYVSSNLAAVPSIFVFAAGASGNVAPIRTITGALTQMTVIKGIAVDASNNIYVISMNTAQTTQAVLKFSSSATGNVAPTASFTSTAWTFTEPVPSLAVH